MDSGPSRTAIMAAVVRGRHRLEEEPPWVLDDPFALPLVGPGWEVMAAKSDERYPVELSRQIRVGVALRSRFAEDRLMAGDFDQYVLLGAGLDSFAWRRPELLDELRVIEVDHPDSQSWKRARMAELGLDHRDRHVFAPVDFEVEDLEDVLDAAGLDRTRKTIFSWLGVIPYLTMPAVKATLRVVAGCAPGSEVVFEYGLSHPHLDELGVQFVTGFSSLATAVGEPLQTGWSPEEAEAVVSTCGLAVVDHPGVDELAARYFAGRPDGLRPWSVSGLLAAEVVGPSTTRTFN